MAKKKTATRSGSSGIAAEPSRSSHIKRYLDSKPGAGPKEIQTELAKKGIHVKTGLISNVKNKYLKRKSKGGPITKRVLKQAGGGYDRLIQFKRLVDQLGGIGEARKALDALEQLK